jgi:hypothetical protein
MRCVWKFLDRSPRKDWRFPFKLAKNGADNSKRFAGARAIDASGPPTSLKVVPTTPHASHADHGA